MRHLESMSHLPVLQTIRIIIRDDNRHSGSGHRFDMYLNSLRLWQAVLLSSGIHQKFSEDSAPVVNAQLCHLHVDSFRILDFLTTPMLQSLAVTDFLPRSSFDSDCITLFLRPSGCRLESLDMCVDIFESEPSASISNIFSSEACSTISHIKLELCSDCSAWYNVPKPSLLLCYPIYTVSSSALRIRFSVIHRRSGLSSSN
ncbi:hypothetical protein DFS33DRAFT_862926 [Desarmillaria ectypa]|nr:hypothetical protein DFS33DRAFT_862926 [Desarmillaria ectypa]